MTHKENANENGWHYRIYLIGLFLILALPLLNLPPLFSPPDWGKAIVFRIILSLTFLLYLHQFLWGKETNISFLQNRNIKILLAPLMIFLALFLLATLFSADPPFSFWGSPYRSGGFLNLLFYAAFSILLFLIVRKKDWKKLWDFSFIVGLIVSLIAFLQQFHILSSIFVTFDSRPASTIGGSIFLAMYLLLLCFVALSFGFKEARRGKKLFYFATFVIFVSTIFITISRAGYLGIIFGTLFFFFLYPTKKIWPKAIAAIFLVASVSLYLYITSYPQLPPFVHKIKVLEIAINRIPRLVSYRDISRYSAWKVSWQALKDKPLLGYGPENFSIGFDKYYDPSLAGLEKIEAVVSSWWDRAHDFIFDIGMSAGIPAIIAYISIFIALLLYLQKVKTKKPERALEAHGIQAGLIAYLVANFFTFDTFTSYLLFFFLFAYSLFLVKDAFPDTEESLTNAPSKNNNLKRTKLSTLAYALKKHRQPIITICIIAVGWFIWAYNLHPLEMNKEINIASYESQNGSCESALMRMEKMLPSRSILDAYLQLKYVDVIKTCLNAKPDLAYALSMKAIETLKNNVEIRPYYTRDWIMLGGYTNVLIESHQNSQDPKPDVIKDLINQANGYFEKAAELSPKRQETYIEWVNTDFLSGDYEMARVKAEKCVTLNPQLPDCYWLLGLSEELLGNSKESQDNIIKAEQLGYSINSQKSLNQKVKIYSKTKNYPELITAYQKLISLEPQNIQHHASLAFTYKEMGDFIKAKEEALKVLEIDPNSKDQVDEFLKALEH